MVVDIVFQEKNFIKRYKVFKMYILIGWACFNKDSKLQLIEIILETIREKLGANVRKQSEFHWF